LFVFSMIFPRLSRINLGSNMVVIIDRRREVDKAEATEDR
jgi:hypothetical protein